MNLIDRLRGLELLVVTGKGGVGKSTIAVTLGQILSKTGSRVLLLEIDPRESLYPLLDVAPSGGEIVEAGAGLFVQNLRPGSVIDRLVREKVRLRFIADRVLASPVYRHFVDAAPGLSELAVLGHALSLVRDGAAGAAPELDMVILDAPATGHGISLLAAPTLVSEVIHDGPIGQMSEELAAFTSDPDRCGIAVVTLAEEMPISETIELVQSLSRRLDRSPEMIVVNGLYPVLGDAESAPDDAAKLWRTRRRLNDQELDRLTGAWPGPCVDLPLVPFDRGPDLIAALAPRLERELAGPIAETGR